MSMSIIIMIEMMLMITMTMMTIVFEDDEATNLGALDLAYKQYPSSYLPSISRIRPLKTFFLPFFSTVNRPLYI